MYIRVRVTPGAKKELIKREGETEFVIAVKEKAERLQANRRVIEILQDEFHGKRVRLVSGHTSSNKLFEVE